MASLHSKQRWMQFSIRAMLIAVTILCAWLSWQVEQARRQREAINELHKLHVAVLYRDPAAGRGEERNSGGATSLLGIAYREPVEYVGLHHAHEMFHDPQQIKKALSLLADLRGLKNLNMEGMPITDKDVMYLKRLTDLRKLNLSYTEVTNTGLAELQQALPNCQIMR